MDALSRRPTGWARRLAIGAACLPALVPLWLIARFGVDVPYWDEWDFALLLTGLEGPVSAATLLAPHNQHRIPVPLLLFLANSRLAHWNLRYEMFAMWGIACLTVWCVWRLGRASFVGRSGAWLALLLSTLFVFSPIQAASWLFGVQLVVFIPVACTVGGILLASRRFREAPKIAGCAALSLVGTLSMGYGLLSWIVIWPVLVSAPVVNRRERTTGLLLFPLVAGLVFLGYVHGLPHTPVSFALGQPVRTVAFALIYLGAPLAFGTALSANALSPQVLVTILPFRTALIVATVELALVALAAIYAVRRRGALLQMTTPWIALSAFAISSSVLVAVARLDLGLAEALAPRYFTVPLLLPVSLTYLVGLTAADASRLAGGRRALAMRLLCTGLALAAIVLSVLSWRYAWAYARLLGAQRLAGKAAVTFVDYAAPSDLQAMTALPLPEFRRRAHALDRAGFLRPPLATSADISTMARRAADPRVAAITCGKLETVLTDPRGTLNLEGWAVLPWRGAPADAVLLAAESREGRPILFAISPTWLPRRDVSEAMGTRYERSGWTRRVPRIEAPRDAGAISAWAYDAAAGTACQLENVPQFSGTTIR